MLAVSGLRLRRYSTLRSLEQEHRQAIEEDVRVGEPAFNEVEGYTSVRRERWKSGVFYERARAGSLMGVTSIYTVRLRMASRAHSSQTSIVQ